MEHPDARRRAMRFLEDRGASTIDHPGGTLLAHLVRTDARLERWGAGPDLRLAGLCHAAYGTDGFPPSLVDRDARADVIDLIGAAAEAVVHVYGSCDRQVLHPQLGAVRHPEHRNRFTGETRVLSDAEVEAFVALTVANELDIVVVSPGWAAEHGPGLATLLRRWEPLMPPAAVADCRSILGSWQEA